MFLKKITFFVSLVLIFGASSRLGAETLYYPPGYAELPAEINATFERVFQIWTPGAGSPVVSSEYANRRRALEKNLSATDTGELVRSHINLAELKRCADHDLPTCRLSTSLRRQSAFVLNENVLQATRHVFSQDQSGLSEFFAQLASHWQNARSKRVDDDISRFNENPLREAIFILSDKSGKIVFNSASDGFRFLRFGNVSSISGRVELKAKTPRAYIFNEDPDLESSRFNGLSWVAHDFVQIQLEKSLPALNRAEIRDCQPGHRLFTVGYARGLPTGGPWATDGHALSLGDFAKAAQGWRHLTGFLKDVRGRNYLLAEILGADGMEGAPILMDDGRVCGIFKEAIRPRQRSLVLTIPY